MMFSSYNLSCKGSIFSYTFSYPEVKSISPIITSFFLAGVSEGKTICVTSVG